MTTNASRNEHTRVIRASEVGAYAYCARAWWLGSVKGLQPDDVGRLHVGRVTHEKHGQHVFLSTALTRLSYLLLVLAALAGLGWFINVLGG
jgi:hypothetical protein